MNLEQRVQALEQELQILKHQIQATLLDIREQMLNNAYPELRAEEVAAVQPSMPPVQPSVPDEKPIRQAMGNPEQPAKPDNLPANVRRVSLSDLEAEPPARHSSHPTTKLDSYDEMDDAIQASRPVSKPARRPLPEPEPPTRRSERSGANSARNVSFDDQEEDEQPVRSRRTPKPTQPDETFAFDEPPAYRRPGSARRDSFDEPDETHPSRPAPKFKRHDASDQPEPPLPNRLTLSDFDTDYQNPGPTYNDDTLHFRPVRRVPADQSPIKAQPFTTDEEDAPPFITQSELITEADWATLEMLEDWVGRKVKQFGPKHTRELIKAYAAQGRFDPRMKGALLQLVTILSMEGEPTNQPTAAPAAPEVNEEKQEEEPSQQKTILRLIAGIQNAGINNNNTGRKKTNG